LIASLNNPAFCRLARSLIAEGKMVRCKAAGASMFPAIRDGDLVTLSPVDPERLKPGQVIAFETSSGTLTIHRLVVTRSHDGHLTFVTRGDARLGNDAPFGADRLVGQVVEVRRDGRQVAVAGPACLWLARLRLRIRAKLTRTLAS
jgi:signal peptidase I